MDLTRRDFLKVSGATAVGIALSGAGFGFGATVAYAEDLRIKSAKMTTTVCPYCAVGCGILVHTIAGKIVNTEGDPDSPINRGSLCSKGGSLIHLSMNDRRLAKPMYRAPYSSEWKEVSWDWALDRIAERVKKERDAGFIEKNAKGEVVNRIESIASVGSAAMDNEECYLYVKMLRSLGLVYIEHQARI